MAAAQYGFVYQAPAVCPARAEIVARINRYAPDTVLQEGTGADGRIDVIITSDGSGFQAAIRGVRTGEAETAQVVPGVTCAETANAAALVIAILVDPDAGLHSPEPPRSAVTPVPESSAANAPGSMNEPAATPAPASSAVEAPAPDRGTPPPSGARESRPARWTLGVSGLVGATSALGRLASLDVLAGAHIESRERITIAPFVGVFLHYAASTLTTDTDAEAAFRLLAGRVSACPVRAWFGRGGAWIAPCASFELGQLRGTGNTVPSYSPAVLWAAAGLAGRSQVQVGPLFLAAEVGVSFPLLSDHFYFAPSETPGVYEVPPVAVAANLGLGASIP